MIAAVICLAATCGALVLERILAERVWASERRRLITAVLARHAGDLAAVEAVERMSPAPARRRTGDPSVKVNEWGQIVDDDGQVIDESALIGLGGN